MIIAQFYKMMTLNQLAIDLLYNHELIEKLCSLPLDEQYHKQLAIQTAKVDRQMEYRMLINNLAHQKQEISDRIVKTCNKNIQLL